MEEELFTPENLKEAAHKANDMQRNTVLKADFIKYLNEHPELRFWQALRSWSGAIKIMYGKWDKDVEAEVFTDTFYFEGKNE